jgi:hypothetical protein
MKLALAKLCEKCHYYFIAPRRPFGLAGIFLGIYGPFSPYKDTKAWIEIASWSSANPLWFREGLVLTPQKFEPFCHFLNETDFEECRQQ